MGTRACGGTAICVQQPKSRGAVRRSYNRQAGDSASQRRYFRPRYRRSSASRRRHFKHPSPARNSPPTERPAFVRDSFVRRWMRGRYPGKYSAAPVSARDSIQFSRDVVYGPRLWRRTRIRLFGRAAEQLRTRVREEGHSLVNGIAMSQIAQFSPVASEVFAPPRGRLAPKESHAAHAFPPTMNRFALLHELGGGFV